MMIGKPLSGGGPALALVLVLLFLVARWVRQVRLEYALASAASDGDTDRAKALLAKGANVNSQRVSGMTALMHAAAEHHPAVVELLLQRHAAVDLKKQNGATALMLALTMALLRPRAAREVVRVLLANGADVNASMNTGKSPISWAREMEARLHTDAGAIRSMYQQLTQSRASVLRSETYGSPDAYAASLRAVCEELLRHAAA